MNPLLAPGKHYVPPPSGTTMQFRAGAREDTPPTLEVEPASLPPPPPPTLPAQLQVQAPPPLPPPSVMQEAAPSAIHSVNVRNVTHHWFYRTETILEGDTHYWKPFDMVDSMNIEGSLESLEETTIPVMGGRYDVNTKERRLIPVYWSDAAGEETPVMRASWFYQGPASHWIPFPEEVIPTLESHYNESSWGAHRRISLGDKYGHVVFHSKDIIFYTPQLPYAKEVDNWGQTQDASVTPRIVHRGLEGLPDIPDGEMKEVDHLIFVVHGVGKYCDMKLRDLIEVVSSMRGKISTLSEKHFQSAHLAGSANRIELLPISWHKTLHGEDTGTDSRLKPLTLKSIPKLRTFMNDTLMDILFYTSPVFGQTIVDTVVNEINRVYKIFLCRNPTFKGNVSVIGHSLGSVILFDILSHQKNERDEVSEVKVENRTSEPVKESEEVQSLEELFEKLDIGSEYSELFVSEGIDLNSIKTFSSDELKEISLPDDAVSKIMKFIHGSSDESKEAVSTIEDYNKQAVTSDVQYVVGPAGTGQLSVNYPQLDFHPSGFYALGSPIALFLAIRGISSLGENFSFPTCPEFFNIFHPYDPVAYRMEAMVNPQYSELRPITIPHHMGRKRMHLELKDTVTKLMTSDIRKKILEGVSYTLSSVYNMATGQSGTDELERTMEDEVLRKEELRRREDESNPKTIRSGLNGGNRIDFVLQEAPLESFNEYLFAIASHISYWDSEDVGLMILKNVYSKLNIRCDEELNITNSEMGSFVDSNSSARPFGHSPYAAGHPSSSPYSMPPLPPNANSPQVSLMPVHSTSYPTLIQQPMTQIYTPSIPPSLSSMVSGPPPVQPKLYDPSSMGGASATPSQGTTTPAPPPQLYDPTALGAASSQAAPVLTPSSAPQVYQPPPMTPTPTSALTPSSTPQVYQPPPMTPTPTSALTPSSTPQVYQPPPMAPPPSVPGGSMSFVRPAGYPKVYPGVQSNATTAMASPVMGMDPTAPLGINAAPIGPPPMGGFVPKK